MDFSLVYSTPLNLKSANTEFSFENFNIPSFISLMFPSPSIDILNIIFLILCGNKEKSI